MFPLILRTIIIAQMLSTGGEGVMKSKFAFGKTAHQ